MAKCPSCGAPIDASLKTCPYCGAMIELPNPTPVVVQQKTEHRNTDDVAHMSRAELKRYIADHEYDIKVLKSWSDDDIRDAIYLAEYDEISAAEESKDKEGCLNGIIDGALGCLGSILYWIIGIVVFGVIVGIGAAIFG